MIDNKVLINQIARTTVLEAHRDDSEIKVVAAFLNKELSGDSSLSETEKEYYNKLKSDHRKTGFVMGRVASKTAIAQFSEVPFSSISITNGVIPYPCVHSPATINPEISLTHTSHFACAIASSPGHPIGIDIEIFNNDKIAAYQRIMKKEEIEFCEKEGHEFYTVFWTMKEALSKTLRTGFTTPFETLECCEFLLNQGFFISHFKNFSQYRGLSKIFQSEKEVYAVSIVYPYKTLLSQTDFNKAFQYIGD